MVCFVYCNGLNDSFNLNNSCYKLTSLEQDVVHTSVHLGKDERERGRDREDEKGRE